ncbi:MAG: hypothetical protein RBT65_18965 [Methanolobus sp.]|jgi:hypothetical protein|nr:hypothetical protein [Methanolobus sp.]
METNFEVLVVETYFKAKKVDVSLLSDYFIKEQKETDSLNPKVFFAECEHAITTLEDKIDTKYMVRKEELTRFIMWAEANGDERSAELNKGELEFWSKDRVGIDLYDLTEHLGWGERKTSNSINLQDIEVISEALEEARKSVIGDRNHIPPPSTKLTLNQIALLYVYENRQITRGDNANKIVKKYGYNSGGALCNKFDYYTKRNNRQGEPKSPTRLKIQNKIDLIESVIPMLSEPNRQKPYDEIKILKGILEQYD